MHPSNSKNFPLSSPHNSAPHPDPSALPAREAEQLRLLVENARDFAMFLIEADGTILSWNPGVQNLLGYEEHEWLGNNCEIIFTPEDRAQDEHLKERETAATEGRAEDERWHLKKDGTRFYASGVMSAVYDEAGNLVSLGKVLRDHTEKKRMEEALQASRDALEARVTERTAALSAALAERQRLVERMVTLQEEERRHISRELHDSTGQYLTAISLELAALDGVATETRKTAALTVAVASSAAEAAAQASRAAATLAQTALDIEALPNVTQVVQQAAQTALTAAMSAADAATAAASAAGAVQSSDKAVPRVTQLRGLLKELSQGVHRLAVDLRPTSIDDLGMVPALEAHVEEWSERTDLAVAFEVSGLEASGLRSRRLPPLVETTVYRIVQEALTNVAKYACPKAVGSEGKAATQVAVTIQCLGKHVQVVVEDDGPGFDVEAVAGSGRLGLMGMRERAELLGGTLEVESEPGLGTSVFLRLPVA